MTTQAIGILGGTFDPVHFGHLRPALEVAEQLNLDHVRLIPNAQPPHRSKPQASAEQRLLMLHLAIKNSDRFVVDDREIQRNGPSYMVDTLTSLRQEFSDTPLYLLMGIDAFIAIQSWHQWQQLLPLAHIVVMQRPGEQLAMSDELLEWYQQHRAAAEDVESVSGKIWPVEVTQLTISSTAIRDGLAHNKSAQFLVPDGTIQVIEQMGLYKQRNG